MSLSEKLKTKRPTFVNLDDWLAHLPADERDAAEEMLSSPREWPMDDLLLAFRAEGVERDEVLLFGEKQVYRWRKANGVSR